MNIKFICSTCQYRNRQEIGTDGYEQRRTEFDTFSDAVKHVIETGSPYNDYTHDVHMEIEENEPQSPTTRT